MPLAAADRLWQLAVEIREHEGGPVLGLEPVGSADLVTTTSELWWRERLRRGCSELPLEALQPQLRPVFRTAHGPQCRAFVLALDGRDGGPVAARAFGRAALAGVARRAVRRLRAEGVLAQQTEVLYDLRADEVGSTSGGAAASGTAGVPGVPPAAATLGVRALAPLAPMAPECEVRALAPLLARARAVDAESAREDDHIVFFTHAAWAAAERCSRRGAAADPPVESGGVLAGTLCACPESGEMFTLVSDVFEATDAEAATFSLAFTARTWATLANVLKVRRSAPAAPPLRLLGSTHGHNFLPAGGAPPCDACADAPVCTRTSTSLSIDDEQFTDAVFRGQPWQLALVFGLSARRDEVAALHGLHGGCLVRRGLHLLPDDVLSPRDETAP